MAANDSILGSIRQLIASDDYFDLDLITHINTVFAKLQQMGVGPEGGFSEDEVEHAVKCAKDAFKV